MTSPIDRRLIRLEEAAGCAHGAGSQSRFTDATGKGWLRIGDTPGILLPDNGRDEAVWLALPEERGGPDA